MTEQEQQIAIAEACGWSEIRKWKTGIGGRRSDWPYKTKPLICTKISTTYQAQIPDYPNSLDAMHTVETTLDDDLALRVKWLNTLREICGRELPKNKVGQSLVSDYHLARSTSAQRAEAFLRTVGKWKTD